MLSTVESFNYYDVNTDQYVDVNGTIIVKYIGAADVGITLTLYSDDKQISKHTMIIPMTCVDTMIESLNGFKETYK